MRRIFSSGRRRESFVQAWALGVLLFAVLPNALYIDHLFLPGEHIDTPEQAQEHAAHCHLGGASCSDPPGPGSVFLLADGVCPSPPEHEVLAPAEAQELPASSLSVSPPKPPPEVT